MSFASANKKIAYANAVKHGYSDILFDFKVLGMLQCKITRGAMRSSHNRTTFNDNHSSPKRKRPAKSPAANMGMSSE
ncbi:protein of unknown function [Candidatus Filomicrobium marinum]|uniref:Uncharacterized protein n=1 Tax=Candidatus Filomicrobium marinum TaxID=1608628 RepID=A0A0D6JEI5_9HYPH|nr:protein of unknown function [Candidatus Filomicrobium marinum]CPR17906.1 protein of unknown function [Candidatus Filomicrobium marinum]